MNVFVSHTGASQPQSCSFKSDLLVTMLLGPDGKGGKKNGKTPSKPQAGNGHRTSRDYVIKRQQNDGGKAGKSNSGGGTHNPGTIKRYNRFF